LAASVGEGTPGDDESGDEGEDGEDDSSKNPDSSQTVKVWADVADVYSAADEERGEAYDESGDESEKRKTTG
jgi:hypothetical protein